MSNYLYNGVELPALPEWDREAYPYAWIAKAPYNDDYYSLIISTGECDYRSWKDYGSMYYLYPVDVPITVKAAYLYKGEFETGEWNFTWEKTYEENIVHTSSGLGLPVWSNFDVINHDDGSIYIAASDPIPVNPAPTLDPTALLMCWQVGNRIRQRGGA